MFRRTFFARFLAAALLTLSGCQLCCHRPFTAARPPCPSCANAYVPSRLQPAPAPAPRMPRDQPPIARIDGPEQAGFFEPAPRDRTPAPPRAGIPGPDEGQPDPLRPEEPFPDESPRVRVLPPVPRRSDSRLPETEEPPYNNVPGKTRPKVEEYSDPKEEAPKTRKPPAVDVPGYERVSANIATGQKPFAEGLVWLKADGVRNILHIWSGEDVKEVDPEEIRKAGFNYLSLTVTPRTLSQEVFKAFVDNVNDIRNQPLYVMDKDSSVAGGLWYLYFRVHKGRSDTQARALAKKYGFRFDDDSKSSHKDMEIAIQALLPDLMKK